MKKKPVRNAASFRLYTNMYHVSFFVFVYRGHNQIKNLKRIKKKITNGSHPIVIIISR